MSSPHPDLGPELRRLAQAILDRLDPAMRAAAAVAGERLSGPDRCQQVWCPVCALAALINGEQHPLLTMIADHSGTLLTVVRTMVADSDRPPADPAPPPAGDAPPPTGGGRYHHIPIIVEPLGADGQSDGSIADVDG